MFILVGYEACDDAAVLLGVFSTEQKAVEYWNQLPDGDDEMWNKQAIKIGPDQEDMDDYMIYRASVDDPDSIEIVSCILTPP